jgi:TonB family C-terminal domain
MLSANLKVDSFHEANPLPQPARFFLLVSITAAHVALAWMVLQVPAVRIALAESAPIFVQWVAPAPPPPEPLVIKPVEPPSVIKKREPPKPKAPSVVEKPVVQEMVVEEVAPPVEPPPQYIAAPVIAPAEPALPKTVSISAVRYRKAPAPSYPMASKRLKETGEALVRVLIDQEGIAQRWTIERSSGFERLDEAAVSAIQKASFYPYTENDQPLPVWVVIPVSFNLR